MISNLAPISPNSMGFLALAMALTLIAWSGRQYLFLGALALAGVVMALSWLRPQDVAAMILFLIPPYLIIRWSWGQEDRQNAFSIAGITKTFLKGVVITTQAHLEIKDMQNT